MKYTNIRQSRLALMYIATLAAAFCADQAFANSFDDGMSHTNSTDTTYNEPLYVGLFNPDNTLVIDSGSTLNVEKLVISSGEDSTNNLVSVVGGARLIAGESSTNGLTTGGIVVGDASGNSALTVNNASKLEGEYLYIGFGTNDSGKIELDGEGTEMNIAQDAYVGYAGSTNSVDIGNGSAMNIGGLLTVGSAGGSNNHINVSGTLFINSTNDINVVEEENDNDILVKNGGTLQVGGAVDTGTISDLGIDMQSKSTLELGGELTLSGNKIDDGHNVILNNTLSTHVATWQSSSLAIIGETTSYNTFTFTNGASGTASDNMLVGYAENANYNELNVGGTGSTFTATMGMAIGSSGRYNELNVADGGQVDAQGSLYIGYNTSATGNQANIGSNGTLNVTGDIFVGANGGSNKFNIDQGRVTTASSFVVGRDSDGNSLNINGSNSLLNISQDLIVGDNGGNNTFNMDQGRVSVTNNFILGSGGINNRYTQTGGTNTVAGEFIIGETEEATGVTTIGQTDTTGNLGSVGTNATLNIQQDLTVGREGGGSILLINDGGAINVAGDAVIGEASDDNYIFLQPDDPDSRFTVAGDLVVSKDGENNRFAIYGGTADIAGNLYLGGSTNQHVKKNYIHLETTNAVLNVAGAIHIGASNSVNTLDLAKGAKASAQNLFVGAYDGTTNNVVTVTGNDSLLSVSNNLTIGSNTGSNNTVNVGDGGSLFAGGTIEFGTSTNDLNNRLNINSGGTLHTVDWDYATVSTNIVMDTGTTLKLDGTLSGTNMVEGMNFVLNGSNSEWSVGDDMFVGFETDNNSLTITNGASASTSSNLYIGHSSEYNTVQVTGTGSVLSVANDLFVGYEADNNNLILTNGASATVSSNLYIGFASANNTVTVGGAALIVVNDLFIGNVETNDSAFNTLFVTDNGLVTVGDNLENSQAGTLKIGAGSQVRVTGNYEQNYLEEFDAPSRLEVGVSSNEVPPNLEVGGTANFEEKTTIAVYDDGVYGNTNVVQTIVLAGELTIGEQTATTGLLLDLLNIETNSLLDFDITVSNNMIIVDNFIVLDIGEELDLEGQLLDVANELVGMATNGNELAKAWKKTIEGLTPEEGHQAIDNYYGEKASSAPMHNVINRGIGSVASELTVRGDTTRKRATAPVPSGASGPHAWNQELQGWISGYGSWGTKSDTDGFHGYDANLGGFVIGADLAVSKNILVGLAGGSNSGSVDKDNGASGDTKTTYGAVYASIGTHDWFLDGSMIYGSSSIDTTLGDVFDTTAAYDARNLAFYLGGGKEIIGKYLIITPEASLLANYYEQDAYDEESSDTVARSVDSFDALYVQSALGCNLGIYMAMGKVVLKPELRAHWLHEFNGEESLPYQLVGGDGTPYNMLLQAPEEDILQLGAGVAAKMSEYLDLRFDLDTRLGSAYSDYTVTGSLRYQF